MAHRSTAPGQGCSATTSERRAVRRWCRRVTAGRSLGRVMFAGHRARSCINVMDGASSGSDHRNAPQQCRLRAAACQRGRRRRAAQPRCCAGRRRADSLRQLQHQFCFHSILHWTAPCRQHRAFRVSNDCSVRSALCSGWMRARRLGARASDQGAACAGHRGHPTLAAEAAGTACSALRQCITSAACPHHATAGAHLEGIVDQQHFGCGR